MNKLYYISTRNFNQNYEKEGVVLGKKNAKLSAMKEFVEYSFDFTIRSSTQHLPIFATLLEDEENILEVHSKRGKEYYFKYKKLTIPQLIDARLFHKGRPIEDISIDMSIVGDVVNFCKKDMNIPTEYRYDDILDIILRVFDDIFKERHYYNSFLTIRPVSSYLQLLVDARKFADPKRFIYTLEMVNNILKDNLLEEHILGIKAMNTIPPNIDILLDRIDLLTNELLNKPLTRDMWS